MLAPGVWPVMHHVRGPLIALAALALVACVPRGGGGPTNGDAGTSRPSLELAPSQEPGSDGIPEELLAEILDDASTRADRAVETLEVETAEAVTWNDGSLGCPEPGVMYTQALVPGYHVVVRAGTETLDYRATESGQFRICESPLHGDND